MRHLSAYFLPLNEPIAGMYFDWNFYSVLHQMKVRKIRKMLKKTEMLSGKNARAWVSMVLYLRK